ncbi:RDD family protein [Rathayibacter soli]|uniref:RDD family protein n=1 Tax=Rathayibacter soli TaxID=3144168 RepID=UPI0027E5782C|nr:RDD family protein [Glaciibacter superstes]
MASSDANPAPVGQRAPSRFPGERLGLPESGSHSVARAGRRFAGIAIDWAIAVVFSVAFFHYDGFATMIVFVVLQIVFIPTIGGSIGHRLLGLRVVPIAGGWVGPWRPIVRSVLLAVVIPAVIWDSDQRGFHDKVAGTVLIRG